MPITRPVQERTFSLFDADLPLLAADAAAEIELLTNSSHVEDCQLPFTVELLQRLKSISSTTEKFNVDRLLYQKSLLPSVSPQEQTLFEAPSEVDKRLNEFVNKHDLFTEEADGEFFTSLKSFFLEVSSFASASRSMLRNGSGTTPYATL